MDHRESAFERVAVDMTGQMIHAAGAIVTGAERDDFAAELTSDGFSNQARRLCIGGRSLRQGWWEILRTQAEGLFTTRIQGLLGVR